MLGCPQKNGSFLGGDTMRVVVLAIIYLCVAGISGFVSFGELSYGR